MNETEPRGFFEPQYALLQEELLSSGRAAFGLMSSYTWNTDPKRLLFVLSRYVAKLQQVKEVEWKPRI